MEFYGDGRATSPASASDCAATEPVYPTGKSDWNDFDGQIYTGPWDAEGETIHLEWNPSDTDEQVTFAVRFMEPPTEADPNYLHAEHAGRPATVCEESDADFVADSDIFERLRSRSRTR